MTKQTKKGLSETQKAAIVDRFTNGETNKTALAREFDTSARTIGRILEATTAEVAPLVEPKTFKVGDLVTGNSDGIYQYTTDEATMEVVSVDTNTLIEEIEVKILFHSRLSSEIGRCYLVEPEYFTKIGEVSRKEVVEPVVEPVVLKGLPYEGNEESYNTNLLGETVILNRSAIEEDYGLTLIGSSDEQILGVVSSACVDGCPDVRFETSKGSVLRYLDADPMSTSGGKVHFELIDKSVVEEVKIAPVVHFTITEMAVALTVDGNVQVIDFTHPLFTEIKQLVVDGAYLEASEKMDMKKAIELYSGGRLKIIKGIVEFDGREISNALTGKMINLMGEGDEGFKGFAKFFELVMENPSKRTRERLMDFVAAEDIGISIEGHIVAFKNVKDDFRPSRSGKWTEGVDSAWVYNTDEFYDNNVGESPSMPRSEVDDIEDNTCSTGLHVCSVHYLKSMWGTSGQTMKVTIHPADVVAIPPDYNNSKARTCKYTVVENVTKDLDKYLGKVL